MFGFSDDTYGVFFLLFFSFVFWLFCSNDESDDVYDPIVLLLFCI